MISAETTAELEAGGSCIFSARVSAPTSWCAARLQFPLSYFLVNRTVEDGRDMGANHGGIEHLHQMWR
jgi:hypothetical protein